MNLRKKTISGLLWTFGQQFGAQLVGFAVSLVLARILIPEEFGLIGMITVFMAIGQTLIDAGFSQSLIRSEGASRVDYSTVFIFNIICSLCFYGIIFLSAPLIASFYQQPLLVEILRVYSISFVINAFSTIQLTILTKNLDFKTQLLATIPSLIISGIFGVLLAHKGFGVWSLVYMTLTRSFLTSLQLWLRSKWRPTFSFSWESFRTHFHFGYKLTIAGLIDTIFKNIYQVVIGRFFSPSQVGFYTRADTLKQLPVSNLSNALNKVTYPIFATIKDDDSRLKSAYKQIMQMVVFIISPVLCLLGSVADDLFILLFTDKWLPAAPYFQIMCLIGILYPLHSYNLNVLKVKGRSDLFLRLELYKRTIAIIILFITMPKGIFWMLWGQLISSCVGFVINTYYTGIFLKYKASEQLFDILPIVALALGVGFVSFKINGFCHSVSGIPLFVKVSLPVLVGGITYFLFARLFKISALYNALNIILRK